MVPLLGEVTEDVTFDTLRPTMELVLRAETMIEEFAGR